MLLDKKNFALVIRTVKRESVLAGMTADKNENFPGTGFPRTKGQNNNNSDEERCLVTYREQ